MSDHISDGGFVGEVRLEKGVSVETGRVLAFVEAGDGREDDVFDACCEAGGEDVASVTEFTRGVNEDWGDVEEDRGTILSGAGQRAYVVEVAFEKFDFGRV